ncbi:MAG: hypothetical protein INQ03_23115 [Candidatus Heimdallarchaeota archaeon]|nr:hypothetical protein [Candidatus Heimdallarchaeota archaeon]
MLKITIIGNAASGKSTLAMKIAAITGSKVYHLDKILWNPGWVRTEENSFLEKHKEIIIKKAWIIEGVAYESTWEQRCEASDIIIFLDPPLEQCKRQALQRMKEDQYRPNPFVPDNCPYPLELKDKQMELLDFVDLKLKPKFLALLDKFTHKQIYHIKNNDDETTLLNTLKRNAIE